MKSVTGEIKCHCVIRNRKVPTINSMCACYCLALLLCYRQRGSHSSISAARVACKDEGGRLLELANAQDAVSAFSANDVLFRIQGKTKSKEDVGSMAKGMR